MATALLISQAVVPDRRGVEAHLIWPDYLWFYYPLVFSDPSQPHSVQHCESIEYKNIVLCQFGGYPISSQYHEPGFRKESEFSCWTTVFIEVNSSQFMFLLFSYRLQFLTGIQSRSLIVPCHPAPELYQPRCCPLKSIVQLIPSLSTSFLLVQT